MTYCTRKIPKQTFSKHYFSKVRCVKQYTKDIFIEKLGQADWNKCFYSTNVNGSWLAFKDIFMSCLNSVAPIKEVRLKQRTEPWMSSEILDFIKLRDSYLYKFRKHGNQENYSLFCKFRNIVQREVKIAKSSYFANQISENRNKPKSLWQHLKQLGYKSHKSGNENVVLNIENENCHSPLRIANHFNNFFTTVASKLVDKLPSPSKLFDTDSYAFLNFYKVKNSSNNKFVLKHVSESFVLHELKNLNSSKSTGLDEIPARFLKDAAVFLKLPITFIINMSISENYVPDNMKIARVKPLFKKNSNLDVGNYRPVSILSIVSKILEKSVYSQLEKFLIDNNLLYELQSGFRNSYSTDTCLIHLMDHIRNNSAKGLYTGMIMLDLQKAFDTVDHQILCKKLEIMGVTNTEWFMSYLTGRQQTVSVNNVFSDYNTVNCGVPQGSILGPLLFLCYVNDMTISISSECKLILYADDSAILFSHTDPNYISSKLGTVLESCSSWLVDNKLSLHLGKTECVMFGSKRKLKKVKDFKILCNGHTIEPSKSVKYLGLSIDNCLSGETIVNSIVSKVNSRLKFLYRQARFLDCKTRKYLCSALIQCHLDYSCSSWYPSLNNCLKNKLQICQNKVIRFINGMGPRESVNSCSLAKMSLLNVDNRNKQLRLNHVFKIVNNKCPLYMNENFTYVKDVHSYSTRANMYNFSVPKCYGKENMTFFYCAIKDWNDLPNHIKNINNLNKFKASVKLHLLSNAKEQ